MGRVFADHQALIRKVGTTLIATIIPSSPALLERYGIGVDLGTND
ncbi:MAG: hypothetical protein AB1555_11765 [Nitrospirota bacterium]